MGKGKDQWGWGSGTVMTGVKQAGAGCWGVGRGRWKLRKLQYHQRQEGRLGGTEGLPRRTVGARRWGSLPMGDVEGQTNGIKDRLPPAYLKCHRALRAILRDLDIKCPQSSSRTP